VASCLPQGAFAHWALRILDAKDQGGTIHELARHGSKCAYSSRPYDPSEAWDSERWYGVTLKPDEEVAAQGHALIARKPNYRAFENSCQHFAVDFFNAIAKTPLEREDRDDCSFSFQGFVPMAKERLTMGKRNRRALYF
jgi:hypothetical protein